jgi:ferredoxin--NADP+ reductase
MTGSPSTGTSSARSATDGAGWAAAVRPTTAREELARATEDRGVTAGTAPAMPAVGGVSESLRRTPSAAAGPPGDPVPGGAASDDPENGRPIATGSPRYNARLVRRLDLTGSLAVFWVAPDDGPARFEAGQYFALGVEVAGTLVQRPYSAASSPRSRAGAYEFYVRLVTGGVFTPLLWRLESGHRLSLGRPKGRFVLTADADRTHLLIATGTGVAPFVSMLRTLRADRIRRRAVVLHGASYVADLGYRAELEAYQGAGADPLRYVPTISRPWAPENAAWNGRTGRVETLLPAVYDELGLRPESAVAYLCGNPEMVARVEAYLRGRGCAPADIKKELYWPAGRAPGRAVEPAR